MFFCPLATKSYRRLFLSWRLFTRTVSHVCESHWERAIRIKNPSVNAFVHLPPTTPSNASGGSLKDVGVAVKDNICTASMPTTCSSAMLRGGLNTVLLTSEVR